MFQFDACSMASEASRTDGGAAAAFAVLRAFCVFQVMQVVGFLSNSYQFSVLVLARSPQNPVKFFTSSFQVLLKFIWEFKGLTIN